VEAKGPRGQHEDNPGPLARKHSGAIEGLLRRIIAGAGRLQLPGIGPKGECLKETSGDDARAKGIVLIGTSLSDRPIQRHFAALGRELIELGHQAALLVHGPTDDSCVVDPRVRILRWPSPRPTRLADMLFFDRLVRRLKPRCVVSNFGSQSIMMTIGGLRGVPMRIHWHHTLSSQVEADWPGNRLVLRLLRLRARIPFSFVTHAIANSKATRQDLIDTFGVPERKCHVFWNSLEDPLADPVLALAARAQRPNPRRFVCVGRFAASKGQDVLLKAMAEVVQQHPDLNVEFIGGGPFRVFCEELAGRLGVARNCVFAGSLPHPKVLSALAGSWATVVPSRNEAFGLVNIESMAVGVPVIGSNTGGTAEIIRDGVDGFLFPPGDHKALAGRMVELMENKDLRARMATPARRRFLEHFEISHAVQTQARWIIQQVRRAEDGDLVETLHT
jgi:glycosyltransferase involved in cell wall biosynthesis